MEIFLVACVMLVILFALKFYIYKRLLRNLSFFVGRKWIPLSFLGAIALAEIMFFIAESVMFFTKKAILSPEIHIAVGSSLVLIYALLVVTIVADILKGLFHLGKIFRMKSCKSTQIAQQSSKSSKLTDPDNSRRKFLKSIFDYWLTILFFLISIKSLFNALSVPYVRQVKIKIKGLKSPKTIAMVSDVHIGKTLGREFLQNVVKKLNAMNPDIIVIVGDLVDDQIEQVKDHLEPLRDLQSKEGVYYVAGNHEYYHGVEEITEYLQNLNLHILHNTNIELEEFNLAGVSDLAGVKFKVLPPDLQKAKRGLNPSKPSILLAHQPKFVRQNNVSEFDLVLCGHTHAGQVFPLSIFVWLDQHYVHGHYHIPRNGQNQKKTQLYVSSGVGFWGPPVRFLAPSEIVQIELETQD